MIYSLVILAVLLFIFMPYQDMIAYGVSDSDLINAYCYVLMHASWSHLLINCLSILIMWVPFRRMYCLRYDTNGYDISLAVYLSAVIAGLVCATAIPTVGMSGCVFFLLGAILMLNPTWKQLRNYVWVLLSVLIQIYFGKSNVALHLFAFAEGCIYICVREFIYQYTHDTGLFSADKDDRC